ncbi:hypothetical protein KAR91_18390 [Candidatus Pacearchaeota archaeon]|nr:hypothetical protein [Candidatus Pacearchaeota archaeon]
MTDQKQITSNFDGSTSILAEAHHTVQDRRKVYGSPVDNHTQTAAIWSVLFDRKFTAAEVALAMIAVKMSRLITTPNHRDSVVDIAGYVDCYDCCIAAKEDQS